MKAPQRQEARNYDEPALAALSARQTVQDTQTITEIASRAAMVEGYASAIQLAHSLYDRAMLRHAVSELIAHARKIHELDKRLKQSNVDKPP